MDGVFFGVIGGCILALIIAFNGVKKQKVINDTITNNVLKNVDILIKKLDEKEEKDEQLKNDILMALKRIEEQKTT